MADTRSNSSARGCLIPIAVLVLFGFLSIANSSSMPSWLIPVAWVAIIAFVAVSSRNRKKKLQQRRPAPSLQPADRGQSTSSAASSAAPSSAVPSPPDSGPSQHAPPTEPPGRPIPKDRTAGPPIPSGPALPAGPARPAGSPVPPTPPMSPEPGLPPDLLSRITDLKTGGHTIQAIEELRAATGMELYEASQVVRKLGKPEPDARASDSDDW